MPNRFPDRFQHRFRVFAENAIFKTKDLKTLFLEIPGSLYLVVFPQHREVFLSVKFDDQRTFRTIKIDNIRTNAVLSAEFLSEALPVPKVRPHHSFSGSPVI